MEQRQTREYRSETPVALRAARSRTIGGYGAIFNRTSENLGGFVEQVDPTAFNKTRGDGWNNVVCRFNHSDDQLLGRTGSGTLRLATDNTGLSYDVDLPECRSDVLELVTRGDVANSSFAFQCFEDSWATTDNGYPMRTLIAVRLIDVAPVVQPAYSQASVGLRSQSIVGLASLAKHFDADLDDVVQLAQADELRRLFSRTDTNSTTSKSVTTRGISGSEALKLIEGRRGDGSTARLKYLELMGRRWVDRPRTPAEHLVDLYGRRWPEAG